MLFNHTELNENIIYLAENLNFIEKKLKCTHSCCLDNLRADSELMVAASNEISNSIHSCLRSRNSSRLKADAIKSNIFTFMLKRHMNEILIVPSPKLSFELIIHLAIQNQLENLSDIFGSLKEKVEFNFNEAVCEYLLEILSIKNLEDQFVQSTMLFAIGFIGQLKCLHFGENSSTIDALIHQVFDILEHVGARNCFKLVNTEKNINTVLALIYKLLSDALTDRGRLDFGLFAEFVYFMSREYSEVSIKIENKNLVLELLSLLHAQSETINNPEKMPDFYNYLVNLVEKNFSIKFNEYFIIINKLFGYEELFKKVVLDKKYGEFSLDDLECLHSCMDQLTNEREMYILLKHLDSPLTNEKVVNGLRQCFWSLFDKLDLNAGINLISRVYNSNELRLTSDGSILCLDSTDMRNSLAVGINQISFGNCEDEKIIKKLSSYMCVYLRNVVRKMLTNALNNKSQIPTVVKIFRKFSALLECRVPVAGCGGKGLLIECLKSHLNSIIENRNEKMFHNYSKLLVDISREPRLYRPDDYFVHVLKEYLSLVDIHNSQMSFSYAYDLYEIVYKTSPVQVTHLGFFLQVLNVLKFSKQDLELVKLKEKTVYMIRFAVSKLGQFPVAEKEIEWLRETALEVFWPISTLISSITGEICLPSSLKALIEVDKLNERSNLKIIYFSNAEEGDPNSSQLIYDIFELISINPGFNGLLNNLSNLKYVLLIKETLKIVTQPRSCEELNQIFQGLITIFNRNEGGPIDFIVMNTICESYVRFLSFISELIYILHTEANTTYFLTALMSFLKEYCFKDDDLYIDNIVVTVYFFMRLCFVLDMNETQEISKFLVEILNHTVRIRERQAKCLSTSHKELLQISAKNLLLIEDKINKNYKYLLKQNLETLLDPLKTK